MLWEISKILLGIVFLVYYLCICLVMRKWNSTFSRFWIVAGLGMIGIHFIRSPIVDILLAFSGLVFFSVEFLILKEMFPGKVSNLPYIIVLGAKVNGTVVSESLRRRLDAAAELGLLLAITICFVHLHMQRDLDTQKLQAYRQPVTRFYL